MKSAEDATWVVYLMNIRKADKAMNAVCEQREWDEMERLRPGEHALVRSGIASEAEAERLARGTSGDRPARITRN